MKLSSFLLAAVVQLFGVVSLAQTFDGYALYNMPNQNTVYLIDKNGNIAHTWSCSVSCNYAVRLKEDGNIVRGGVYNGNQLNGAAIGGMIQEIDPSGNVVWQYIYSNASHCSHHDFTVLPNGNVILTAWEVKSVSDLTQAGYNNPSSSKWPTHFVELQPDGNGSATIVWEWHMWDHLVQDNDPSKDNYGVVANHPELMDIDAVSSGGMGGPGGGGQGGDWFHVNGVDYNPTLDQIVFSSRYASEIFVIDHSTTTAEAASHLGGNSGKGGDFLYRWGNASNYGQSGQIIPAAVHDAHWVKEGRPNAGYIQIFNNEGGSGNGSVVDAINPPLSGYNYTMTGNVWGPSAYDWRHVCLANSTGQSSSDRMTNGNTFVNVANQYMYEVDQNGSTVWQYNAGPQKAFRYECDYPGIIALLGADPCGLAALSEEKLSQVSWYPNPSNDGIFTLDGVTTSGSDVQIIVTNALGQQVLVTENTSTVDLSHAPNGVYFVRLVVDGNKSVTKKLSVIR